MNSNIAESVRDDVYVPIARNVAWDQIDTVMLDMDGTLIDLYFDDTIWNRALPRRFAKSLGVSVDAAKDKLYADHKPPFTLNFYSIDYWSNLTGIDLMSIHHEYTELFQYRPGAVEFLSYLKGARQRVLITTNSHPKSFNLKDRHLNLGEKVDAVYSSATFGVPKENLRFWSELHEVEPFDPTRTLFIDDASFVLDKGFQAGIGHLLTIKQPNSRRPPIEQSFYEAVDDFRDLIPV